MSLGYVYQGMVMAVGLWVTPFMLKHIGQHDYGVWLVGSQVLCYLMMLDFGVVALLPRQTAYATGRAGGNVEQARDLPKIIGETACVVLHQMPVVITTVLLVWFLMPKTWSDYRGPITLALATFTVMFPLRIFQAVLEGLQDLKFIGQIQILIWSTSTLIMVLLVLRGFGLWALAIGWSATQLLSAGIMCSRVMSKFRFVLPHRLPKLVGAAMYKQLSSGFWVSLTQIAQPLLAGGDVLVIGKLFGPVAVVPYACTAKLIGVLGNQPNLIMQAATPGLSELKAGGEHRDIFKATTALTQALLMLSGAVACVVLAVNRGFVTWWVGPKQFGGVTLTTLMVVGMLLRHWSTSTSYAAFCFGYERRVCVAAISDALVTVAASVILVHQIGIIGAPIGNIIGVCLVTLPVNLKALCRETDTSFADLVKPLWPWAWRFLALAAAATAANRVFPSESFVQSAALAVLFGLAYVGVMYHPSQNSVLGSYLRPRLLPIWRKLSCAW